MYETCDGLKRRISNLEYEVNGQLNRIERNLKARIQVVHEEGICWEDLEDLRQELFARQNRFFRVFARELRKLREAKK